MQASGDAEIQHIPGRGTQIRLYGQIHAEAVHKQADRSDQHIQDDGLYISILSQIPEHIIPLNISVFRFFPMNAGHTLPHCVNIGYGCSHRLVLWIKPGGQN